MSEGLSDIRLRRLDLSGRLVCLSPLHVGSGQVETTTRQRDGEEEKSEIGLFAMAEGDVPWLPPTALKGLMRRLDRGGDKAMTDSLFGQIKDDDSGRMGALLFRGSRMLKAGQAIGKGSRKGKEGQSSVLTRTAIDAGRGISERNKLFSREVVGEGAEFEFRLRLECRASAVAFEARVARTLEILGHFSRAGEACLGADTKLGFGRLALKDDRVTLTPWTTEPTGALVEGKGTVRSLTAPAGAVTPDFSLTLRCDFPFLIADSHHERDKDKKEPHLIPLRQGTKAVISASSVLGVLRSRAVWLAELAKMRGAPVAEGVMLELFGSEKRKGRLSLRLSEDAHGAPDRVTSVKIDRFTGAPIEQGLFEIEAETATFRLEFRLAEVSDAARDFLRKMVEDIRENGLDIGHATTRGYGWFRVLEGAQ
ncbi:RAMP superfamily CRISPR-associated protein [Rhodobacter capsulatus]|uniref:RAMP superfamily CRISPR-associated protein n=1 Tax=Rhodobacter capsulatus TaxID=1061 RepID=UPI0003D2F901|nr:RAMP superfamily CRISPR-associated protein [Rhodobacter capsulatus]ETD79194.1 hypothetical protein U716_14950 [Rhodobacter capsulatus B6]